MIVKYNGKRSMFVYKNIDFSSGKAEVDDVLGAQLIEDSNGTFTLWETPKPAPVVKDRPMANKPKAEPKAKPAAKPAVKPAAKAKK